MIPLRNLYQTSTKWVFRWCMITTAEQLCSARFVYLCYIICNVRTGSKFMLWLHCVYLWNKKHLHNVKAKTWFMVKNSKILFYLIMALATCFCRNSSNLCVNIPFCTQLLYFAFYLLWHVQGPNRHLKMLYCKTYFNTMWPPNKFLPQHFVVNFLGLGCVKITWEFAQCHCRKFVSPYLNIHFSRH